MKDLIARLGRTRLIIIGSAAVVVIGVVVGIVATSGSNPPKTIAAPKTVRIKNTNCPLTDLAPPASGIPARPALMVKVGNEPEGARPQSGLNEADIVYDTPAEGFIMRYIAVFQCQDAASIGPVRSVRWVDWHVAAALGSPILTFAGGINPDVDTVMGLKWLKPANLLEGAQAAGHRITSRVAPDNLYTSTSSLYGFYKNDTTLPTAPYRFNPVLPASATPASSLAINFSEGTDVVWKWDATTNTWLHSYGSTPDIDTLTNKQVSTTNIVVLIAKYKFGPYIESTGGSGDVESAIVGEGKGYILRNGKVIAVSWHHVNRDKQTTFTDANGKEVGLTPGRIWVEIVPDTTANAPGALTITP